MTPDGADMAANVQILLVEDDADIQEVMLDVLVEEGYQVQVANNGLEALKMLEGGQSEPSIIVLDLMMPVMDGFSFRLAQKSKPKLAKIPVVVVSADRSAPARMHQLSVAAFLAKPVNLADLLKTLKQVGKLPASA